jgi:REP element-mobilizing transposase RayT
VPQSLACLYVHLIFSTKNRELFIVPDLGPRLYGYIGGILRQTGEVLVEAGGMPDHIHLLVSLGRQASVADTVRTVKANSSRWVHETFPDRAAFGWQNGYGAFTVSHSNVESVREYIRGQAEHHKKRSFQDEYREFLRRHAIEWDERYVWD